MKRTLLAASAILSLLPFAVAAATPAPTPAVGSLRETVTFFYYDDLDRQLPFYEGLLGLEKTMDRDWVKIYRVTPSSSVGLVLNGRGFHAVSPDKPAMLSLVTDDIDAWYARLIEAGVTVRSPLPPADASKDADRAPVRGFIVEDPGGYTIEFFRWQTPPE